MQQCTTTSKWAKPTPSCFLCKAHSAAPIDARNKVVRRRPLLLRSKYLKRSLQRTRYFAQQVRVRHHDTTCAFIRVHCYFVGPVMSKGIPKPPKLPFALIGGVAGTAAAISGLTYLGYNSIYSGA